ncbi:MAG: phosphoglycerate mutase (2,3-diphosphoglycerate-independent) [Anaerolineaceae bacterium]
MGSRLHARGGEELADAVRTLYAEGQTDYSISPIILVDQQGRSIGRIKDGDAVIFCCRRGEREIELTEAFTDREFSYFPRPEFKNLTFVILTLYHEKFKDLPVAFAPTKIPYTLGEIISRAGLRQLHVSESEKFAHVTFFLNGGNHIPFPGEDDERIPSPKGISFEQVPELSLPVVADHVIRGIQAKYDLIVTNFANGDVIGHSANADSKVKCAVVVDSHLGKVVNEAIRSGFVVMVTADHGNLEELTTPEGTPHVSHTTNPVEFILIDPLSRINIELADGRLADIAPTILSAMGVAHPEQMTGKDLAPEHDWQGKRRVLLIILDGWGIGKQNDNNPIFLADTPVWDDLLLKYPHSQLQASGENVGLVAGKNGNSEAGHMNIGAGRVILQDDVRLDQSMKDGTFEQNEIFCRTLDGIKQRNASLHLIGLLSEKSSHGSLEYPLALLKMAKNAGLKQVFLHMILDGRSTDPGSAPALLEKLENQMDEIGLGQTVTGMGRGFALDRDNNYEKIQHAFDALVSGVGKPVTVKSADD